MIRSKTLGRSTVTEDTTFCDADDAYVLDVDLDIDESTAVESGSGLVGGTNGPMFVTSAFTDDSSSDDSMHGGNNSWSYQDTNNVFGNDPMDEEVSSRGFDPRRLFVPTSNRGLPSITTPRASAFTKSSSSSSSSTPHNSSYSTSPKGFPLPANYGLHGGISLDETIGSHNKYQVSTSTVHLFLSPSSNPPHLQIPYLLLACSSHLPTH